MLKGAEEVETVVETVGVVETMRAKGADQAG